MPDSIAEYLLHIARSADAYDRHYRSDDDARAAMREFGLAGDNVEALVRAKTADRAGVAVDVVRELRREGADRAARGPNLGEERTGYIRPKLPEPPTPVPPPSETPPAEPPVEPPSEPDPGTPADAPEKALHEATRR